MFISMAVIAGCGTGKMAGSGPDRSSVAPEVVGRVGGSAVLFEDLQAQYERNNMSVEKADTTRIREMREFLDLYLLYRAKLMEAKEKGLYESEEIVNELRQYELQYAIPYWVENEIQDQLIDEYIDRINREVDATHILVAVPENATPADTLAAWNQLLEARNKALAGEDFERLSSEYSSMSEGRSMGGPLGYFTAGWAVKPFEDVAFSTPAGQISMPFRTQFGYHIILVKDIRERLKDRFVSHIYFNTRTTTPIGDSLAAVAQQVYNQLDNGADWAETVAKYSQD
jgi:peptidyl-prolyl cis-trans isomerase SurA